MAHADPPDDPILPAEMVQMLGKGFDVSWTQFRRRIENYNAQMVRDIAAAGFRNIRLRTNLPADDYLFSILDPQVQDCLDNGLIPIIAYAASEAEQNPDSTHRDQVVAWWRTVAEHYKDASHRLLFDLFIELSGGLKDDYEKINRWYELIVPAIRETNPTRILILPPVHLSDPYYLDKLVIPEAAKPYVMAEWHFYAAGPSKKSSKRLWTTGTEAERKLVTDKIQAALDWQRRTGILTWVGAWMPGNYNKGNDYTVPEQVVFASFMVRELEKAGIPWSVNAVHHFYDDASNRWIQRMLPVRDAMLDPWKIALYEEPGYGGASLRLGVGTYDGAYFGE
ncbi:MAG: glycoside hydrolase family 5 protein, partial [Calditrichaeota bacterium]|nr:glycoside hydrolase family 5 protein [Calditrichota bacterium]